MSEPWMFTDGWAEDVLWKSLTSSCVLLVFLEKVAVLPPVNVIPVGALLCFQDHSQAAESDSASDEHTSETWAGFPQEDSTKSEQCPVSPPPESSTCEATQTHVWAEASLSAPKQPSALKRGMKRGREAADQSAAESTKLMRSIGNTLEKLASREGQGDVISTYCRYFEHRMRILPLHVLPHFLHEVENCLFKYSVDQSLPLQNSTSQFANIGC